VASIGLLALVLGGGTAAALNAVNTTRQTAADAPAEVASVAQTPFPGPSSTRAQTDTATAPVTPRAPSGQNSSNAADNSAADAASTSKAAADAAAASKAAADAAAAEAAKLAALNSALQAANNQVAIHQGEVNYWTSQVELFASNGTLSSSFGSQAIDNRNAAQSLLDTALANQAAAQAAWYLAHK